MVESVLRVLVTGAAGRIGYALVPLICQGLAFGPNHVIELVLFDIPERKTYMEGMEMEITDCNFPFVKKTYISVYAEEAFKDVDVVIFLGAAPRTEGMSRADLLIKNKVVFSDQGRLLDQHAKKDVKVLVVGNPCNTNALILSKSAPSISSKNITCLMRLDQNRASSMIADKYSIPTENLTNVIIWGNHSDTQFPAIDHMKVKDNLTILNDPNLKSWAHSEMVPTIRGRGGSVIKKLAASSAFSAAKAICDHMQDWCLGTPDGTFVTMGVASEECYDIPSDIVCGLPVKCTGNFEYNIVKDLTLNEELKTNLKLSVDQLLQEKISAFSEKISTC